MGLATTTKDLREDSFIEWDFQDQFFEESSRRLHRNDIQLMFRTREQSGLLFKAQNVQKSEYILLEVNKTNLSTGREKVII